MTKKMCECALAAGSRDAVPYAMTCASRTLTRGFFLFRHHGSSSSKQSRGSFLILLLCDIIIIIIIIKFYVRIVQWELAYNSNNERTWQLVNTRFFSSTATLKSLWPFCDYKSVVLQRNDMIGRYGIDRLQSRVFS
jgi:hypothetical protein